MKRYLIITLLSIIPVVSHARTTPVTTKGLTSKGLVKLLQSQSVANVLKDHQIETVKIQIVQGARTASGVTTAGFLITIQGSALGTSPYGPTLRPCMVSVSALRPELDENAPYTLLTREICAADSFHVAFLELQL